MKNKGFTLIELLAVIVILAIIALIATPIILGLINDSRKSANMRSAELVYSGVENAYASTLLKSRTATLKDVYDNLTVENITKGTAPGENDTSFKVTTKENVECTIETYPAGYKVTCGDYLDKVLKTTNEEQAQETYAYMWYNGSSVNGPGIGDDASSLSPSAPSDKDYYLKFKLDDKNKVTNSYACTIFGGEEYCLEGGSADTYGWDTDAAHSTGRVKKLYDIQSANITGVSCRFTSSYSSCYVGSYVGSVNLYAQSDGIVDARGGDGYCSVDGVAYCDVP